MQLCLLHLDDALSSQTDFMASCRGVDARELELQTQGARVRLWGKPPQIESLKRDIADFLRAQDAKNSSNKSQARLWFMGSGDFHHITSLLLEITLDAQAEPVTVIHFDNHPDWVKYTDNLHCGSWVNRAASHANVAKIITIGVTSKDLNLPEAKGANLSLLRNGKIELFPYFHAPSLVRENYGSGAGHRQIGRRIHWQNMVGPSFPESLAILGESSDSKMDSPGILPKQNSGNDGIAEFLTTLLARISTRNVYITVDKDVLHTDDAITNWDQGGMRLPQLLEIIKAIGTNHAIVGADVTGDYSAPNYSGDMMTRWKKRAEIWIDQPHRVPDREKAIRTNHASNMALLGAFREVMG